MVKKRIIRRLSKKTIDVLGEIIEKELKNKNYDPSKIKKGLRGLMGKRMLNPILNTPLKRIESVLKEIPDLIKKQAVQVSPKFKNLFTTQIDPQRQLYLTMLEDLRELVKDPQIKIFIRDNFYQFEKISLDLHKRLAGTPIEKYSDLRQEAGTYKAIIEELYPNNGPLIRIDAHHIIEGRTYEKFKDTWKLLDWHSAEDMLSLPLMYEGHILSPRGKKMPSDLFHLAKEKDYISFTNELKKAVVLEEIDTPEELIKAYKRFYSEKALFYDSLGESGKFKGGERGKEIWKKVLKFLDAVEIEIGNRKALQRELKKFKK